MPTRNMSSKRGPLRPIGVLAPPESNTLVHSQWETHLDGQDKSSLQLGGGAL